MCMRLDQIIRHIKEQEKKKEKQSEKKEGGR